MTQDVLRVAVLVALAGPIALRAQTAIFTGTIRDATDSGAISYAQVEVAGVRGVRTDGLGKFTVSGIDPGLRQVSVRMLGYSETTPTLEFEAGERLTLDIYLERVPRLLKQMTVRGRSMRVPSGFEDIYRRGASGAGHLLIREQIDSLNPRDIAGLLHHVPQLHVSPNRNAPNPLTTSRCSEMVPGTGASGSTILLWFNGVPITNRTALDEILHHTAPSMIQAVEVYNGMTNVPPNFQPACGAVLIWTRKG